MGKLLNKLIISFQIHPLCFLGDLLYEDSNGSKKISAFFSKTGMPRYLLDLLVTIEIDWVALSRRDNKANSDFKLFNSILVCFCFLIVIFFFQLVFIRMSMTDPGWTALVQLGALEVVTSLPVLNKPPSEIFLKPETVNKNGSPANYYSRAADTTIHFCLTLCSKPKWKRLSFKVLIRFSRNFNFRPWMLYETYQNYLVS